MSDQYQVTSVRPRASEQLLSGRPERALTVLAAISFLLAVAGCAGSGKDYDIAPIFPLSADKCEKYNGDESGEGFGASCMVTKEDCERAAADWQEAMRNIPGATSFRC